MALIAVGGRRRRPEPPEPPRPPAAPRRPHRLKISDRCDACGARAYVAAEVNGTDLFFCAHHFARHEDHVRAAAAELLDERWQLEESERRRTEIHQ
jgi:hypothetical protein